MADPEKDLEGWTPPSNDIPGMEVPAEAQAILSMFEDIVSKEWARAAAPVGLKADVVEIPDNYWQGLRIQGRWTLGYVSAADLNAPRSETNQHRPPTL